MGCLNLIGRVKSRGGEQRVRTRDKAKYSNIFSLPRDVLFLITDQLELQDLFILSQSIPSCDTSLIDIGQPKSPCSRNLNSLNSGREWHGPCRTIGYARSVAASIVFLSHWICLKKDYCQAVVMNKGAGSDLCTIFITHTPRLP